MTSNSRLEYNNPCKKIQSYSSYRDYYLYGIVFCYKVAQFYDNESIVVFH
nr:MAG TPA: hypothetical protein [Caudoviricetes sp.]